VSLLKTSSYVVFLVCNSVDFGQRPRVVVSSCHANEHTKMADHNLIACFHPAGDLPRRAEAVIESDRNRSRYAPPRLPSPLPEQYNAPSHHFTPCLQLTFNPPPRRDKRLVCGWDPTCDIVLPNKHGISFHHGAFTFDDHNRLI